MATRRELEGKNVLLETQLLELRQEFLARKADAETAEYWRCAYATVRFLCCSFSFRAHSDYRCGRNSCQWGNAHVFNPAPLFWPFFFGCGCQFSIVCLVECILKCGQHQRNVENMGCSTPLTCGSKEIAAFIWAPKAYSFNLPCIHPYDKMLVTYGSGRMLRP